MIDQKDLVIPLAPMNEQKEQKHSHAERSAAQKRPLQGASGPFAVTGEWATYLYSEWLLWMYDILFIQHEHSQCVPCR